MRKIALLLIFSLALTACVKDQAAPIDDDFSLEEDSQQEVTPVTNEAYQQNVRQILVDFWATQDPQNIKQDLLDLTVPMDYFDFHFDIVVAFDKLEQGADESDQASIEEALEDISEIAEENSWIK